MRLKYLFSTIALLTGAVVCTNAQTTTDFKSYTQTVPGSNQTYALVAIPGGAYMMGSPATEKGPSGRRRTTAQSADRAILYGAI